MRILTKIVFALCLLFAYDVSSQCSTTYTACGTSNWTVPAGVTSINVSLYGAQGGGANGGLGASLVGTLTVTPGQTIQITVGCQPSGTAGGAGGGGNGQTATGAGYASYGGGGASSLVIGGVPVVVAGGGGGTGGGTTDAAGSNGGCPTAIAGTSPFGQGGGGGTTTAGGAGGPPWISSGGAGSNGSFMQGGAGGADPCYNLGPGGGGGGGYYGGGGGGSDCFSSGSLGGGGGGGGSSLIPAGFTCAGNHTGNGSVVISIPGGGSGGAQAANTGPYCVGSTIQLSSTSSGPYAWSGPNGFSSTLQNPTIAGATTAMSGVYTLTVGSSGCTSTATTTVSVTSASAISVNSATICAGNTATLTASGAASYSWTPSGGITGSGSTVNASPASTTVYTVIGGAGTCTSSTTSTVTVNPAPVVSVSSNTPCVNTTLNLTSGGGVSYAWNGPNSFSSSSQNPSIASVTSAHSGIYTLSVTDANSCVKATTINVTVNSLPLVTATGATVCAGQTINLACNNVGGAYSWTGPQSFVSSQQNPGITSATTNMSGSYAVTATDANGCVNSAAAQVVVNPALVINAASNTPVCQNGTLNLFSTSGVSWSWSGPNAFSSLQQNPTISNISVNGTGTYTVVGTDANGCQGTATTNVVINPLPTLNIAVTPTAICIGQQTATLTASGANNYTWTPAATLSGNAGSTVTGTPSVTTAYTVTGMDANNCVNTTTTSITVNPLPTVTVNSASICVGQQTATLTANGAFTYTWSPNVNLSSPSGNPITANPSSTIIYTVTGIDTKGCYSFATSIVTVNPLPNVTVNSPSVCKGKNITLTAQGANTYSWSPLTGLSSSVGSAVSANPASTTTYVVAGTDLNGCISNATSTVTVNPLPVLNVLPSSYSGCVPVCINPVNTNGTGGNCSWNFGNGNSSSSCIGTHCYNTAGTYYAVLTYTDNSTGCVNTDTTITNAFAMPDADFIFSPQPTSILDPVVQFVDATSGAVVSSWNWTFGDSAIGNSNLQNPVYDFEHAGIYDVWLYVNTSKGCKDSIFKEVIIQDEFLLYVPSAFSPNADGINEEFKAKGEGFREFKMYVFDRWGNLVFFTDDINKGWDGRYRNKGADVLIEDAYVWKIELKSAKNEHKQFTGTVLLLK